MSFLYHRSYFLKPDTNTAPTPEPTKTSKPKLDRVASGLRSPTSKSSSTDDFAQRKSRFNPLSRSKQADTFVSSIPRPPGGDFDEEPEPGLRKSTDQQTDQDQTAKRFSKDDAAEGEEQERRKKRRFWNKFKSQKSIVGSVSSNRDEEESVEKKRKKRTSSNEQESKESKAFSSAKHTLPSWNSSSDPLVALVGDDTPLCSPDEGEDSAVEEANQDNALLPLAPVEVIASSSLKPPEKSEDANVGAAVSFPEEPATQADRPLDSAQEGHIQAVSTSPRLQPSSSRTGAFEGTLVADDRPPTSRVVKIPNDEICSRSSVIQSTAFCGVQCSGPSQNSKPCPLVAGNRVDTDQRSPYCTPSSPSDRPPTPLSDALPFKHKHSVFTNGVTVTSFSKNSDLSLQWVPQNLTKVPQSPDDFLQIGSHRRNTGRDSRVGAHCDFLKLINTPINVERLQKWSDPQKNGFGQMLAIILVTLANRAKKNLGPQCDEELLANVDELLEKRDKEILNAILVGLRATEESVNNVITLYTSLRVQTDPLGELPSPEPFFDRLDTPSKSDRMAVARDLTVLLLAWGQFDTRSQAMIQELLFQCGMNPDVIHEWTTEAGKNIWEAFHSEKGSSTTSKYKALKICLGVAGGGLALAATGGLAMLVAPAALGAIGSTLGAGVSIASGALGLGAAGAVVASTLTGVFATTAALFTAVGPVAGMVLFGASGAGLAGVKLANRFGDLANFDFKPVEQNSRVTTIQIFYSDVIYMIRIHFEDRTYAQYGNLEEAKNDERLRDGRIMLRQNKRGAEVPYEFITKISGTGLFIPTRKEAEEAEAAQETIATKEDQDPEKEVKDHLSSEKKAAAQDEEPNEIAAGSTDPQQRAAEDPTPPVLTRRPLDPVEEAPQDAQPKEEALENAETQVGAPADAGALEDLGGHPIPKGLCQSLKIETNFGLCKRFSGSTFKKKPHNHGPQFRFATRRNMKNDQIVGIHFEDGTCTGVIRTGNINVNNTDEEQEQKGGAKYAAWTLFVSGWVFNNSDFMAPWLAVRDNFPFSDHMCLEWENERMCEVSHYASTLLKNEIGDMAARFWVKSVVANVGGAFIVWPWAVTKILVELDNDWTLIAEKAVLAGRCLASVLADSSSVGTRPVTLSGHSFGAAVIFYCLNELYDLGKLHVVQDVLLMGAPLNAADTHSWRKARACVTGRLINAYSKDDWLLAYVFRYMEWRLFVAGLQEIGGVPGVENVDLTKLVVNHSGYTNHLETIYDYIGFH